MKRFKILLATILAGTFSGAANAATYYLDQTNSNFLANGHDYASVEIIANGDDIDFTVNVLAQGFIDAGATPGIKLTMKNFAFNYDNNLTVGAANIVGIDPTNWEVSSQATSGYGPFGTFDIGLKPDKNNTATLSLAFSITGVVGDTIGSYAVGFSSASDPYFATHISGYTIGNETSAKFATTVVPVPAAAWLFGSGLIGLAGFARRCS